MSFHFAWRARSQCTHSRHSHINTFNFSHFSSAVLHSIVWLHSHKSKKIQINTVQIIICCKQLISIEKMHIRWSMSDLCIHAYARTGYWLLSWKLGRVGKKFVGLHGSRLARDPGERVKRGFRTAKTEKMTVNLFHGGKSSDLSLAHFDGKTSTDIKSETKMTKSPYMEVTLGCNFYVELFSRSPQVCYRPDISIIKANLNDGYIGLKWL